ncbi:MAG: prolipoprotein diacylglyceryl transferase [Planctomycetota bacterium]|nr:prolipoprotein diacylglyceryl transferase [Planctomycetota bacterium]
MHPTMFEIPFLPDWLADVKSYGVMMTIAFLTGIWMACRRAIKSHGDPDVVLNMGFIALVCGIVGARIMYVIHYWDTRFAIQPSPIWAAFDIRAGGLEFLGGPILTIPVLMIYLKYIAKVSIRWYLDFSIPALPWGLALTRIGCFLNGCCWGAVCIDEQSVERDRASIPWAVRFPYGSPAMNQQFKFGQLSIPKELIVITPMGEAYPLPREQIEEALAPENEAGFDLFREYQAARQRLEEQIKQGAQRDEIETLRNQVATALKKYSEVNPRAGPVFDQCDRFGLTPAELRVLADQYRSKPVHPAQLYAVINGILLAGLLSLIFYYRRRHGVLLGVFLLIYPVSRFLLELIRQDNPLDYGGLTISQFLGLGVSLLGAVYMWYIYRLPEKCPRAVEFIPPEEVDERRSAGKNK